MSTPNYNGKQPNNTAYVKTFVEGTEPNLWTTSTYLTSNVLQPSNNIYNNLYIPGNLYIDGVIVNPSDKSIKQNINKIPDNITNALLELSCNQYSFKNDASNKIHYGFDAIEINELLPNLVHITPDNMNYKSINYLEIIPLLVNKIQKMQLEIDELKNEIISK